MGVQNLLEDVQCTYLYTLSTRVSKLYLIYLHDRPLGCILTLVNQSSKVPTYCVEYLYVCVQSISTVTQADSTSIGTVYVMYL